MVDRAQEQSRLLDSTRPPSVASSGAGIFVVVTVVGVALGVGSGAAAAASEATGELTTAPLVGLVAAFAVGLVALLATARRLADRERQALQALSDLSSSDPLTGLPNRRFLGDGLDEMLRQTRRTNGRLGVFFIDLDGFRQVNAEHGHQVGDRLMAELARRLRDALGDDDVVVRYGGDEFVALCPDVSGATSAERVARRLLRAIEKPWDHDGASITLSASLGIALTEERCTRPDEVLKDADVAMTQARRQGPGSFALFDRSLRDSLTPSTAERRLREALERGEFRLYYQPIVSLWTKRLVGVEALLRWKDPARGLVGPSEFMHVLEDSGLIVPIGDWILDEVCRQSATWQQEHPDRPALNVKLNISARQLTQADFAAKVEQALARRGAGADRICLEFSEGALLYDLTTAWTALREVKALGVSVALDDFGTGYSSLSYLRQFPLDLLTVDKSFVDGLGVSREDEIIIEHVVGLAKALGIVTVAEGVETEAQADRLRALTCDLAQGYWFSHPQPPAVIDSLLEADAGRHEWRPPDRIDHDEAPAVPADRFASSPAESTPPRP